MLRNQRSGGRIESNKIHKSSLLFHLKKKSSSLSFFSCSSPFLLDFPQLLYPHYQLVIFILTKLDIFITASRSPMIVITNTKNNIFQCSRCCSWNTVLYRKRWWVRCLGNLHEPSCLSWTQWQEPPYLHWIQ